MLHERNIHLNNWLLNLLMSSEGDTTATISCGRTMKISFVAKAEKATWHLHHQNLSPWSPSAEPIIAGERCFERRTNFFSAMSPKVSGESLRINTNDHIHHQMLSWHVWLKRSLKRVNERWRRWEAKWLCRMKNFSSRRWVGKGKKIKFHFVFLQLRNIQAQCVCQCLWEFIVLPMDAI